MACGGRRSITAFEFDTVPTPAPVEQMGFDAVGCFVDDGSDNGQNRVLSGENVKKQPAMTTQVFRRRSDNFSRRASFTHFEFFAFLQERPCGAQVAPESRYIMRVLPGIISAISLGHMNDAMTSLSFLLNDTALEYTTEFSAHTCF